MYVCCIHSFSVGHIVFYYPISSTNMNILALMPAVRVSVDDNEVGVLTANTQLEVVLDAGSHSLQLNNISYPYVTVVDGAKVYLNTWTGLFTNEKNYLKRIKKISLTQLPTISMAKSPETPISQPTPLATTSPTISDVDVNIPTTSTTNNKTFVVVIANEKYQSVAPVPYADNDGQIFARYCHSTLGIPERNIHIRVDATLNNIRTEINWLQQVCEAFKGEASVILYYAGHGIPDEQNRSAYLLPVDGEGSDITTGYKLDDLYATLGKMPAEHITIFMDACFSGSKREEGMLASARGIALKAKAGQPQGNMVVFSAATGDETAYPNKEQGHGMFTYYLLKKLQDTNGNVTLQELGDYITTNVRQQSVVLNGKSQTPTVNAASSLGTDWQNWKLK